MKQGVDVKLELVWELLELEQLVHYVALTILHNLVVVHLKNSNRQHLDVVVQPNGFTQLV